MSETYRNLPSLFDKETAKAEQSKILHLFTLDVYRDGSRVDILHFVDNNYDVVYNGVTYTRFPIKYSAINISSDGTIDKASISAANVNREMMTLIELNDGLRNSKLRIMTVYEKFIDRIYTVAEDCSVTSKVNPNKDLSAYIDDVFIIDSYQADENVIQFQLEPVINLNVKIPRRRFLPNSCTFKFKDAATCGYSGPATKCDKTLENCKDLNNSVRYGGFPGVTGNRRFYI